MKATWLHYHRFRTPGMRYADTVRVLEIRKRTAHIEARRCNGAVVRRYVKLDRLVFS